MPAIGGSIESVSIDGRNFPVAADADSQRKLGGSENEVESNGDSSGRLIKTRVPWSIDGLMLTIDDSRNDHEFLQALSDRSDFFPVAVTYASGQVYQGTGQITGEFQVGNQAQTGAITLKGPGALTPQ